MRRQESPFGSRQGVPPFLRAPPFLRLPLFPCWVAPPRFCFGPEKAGLWALTGSVSAAGEEAETRPGLLPLSRRVLPLGSAPPGRLATLLGLLCQLPASPARPCSPQEGAAGGGAPGPRIWRIERKLVCLCSLGTHWKLYRDICWDLVWGVQPGT